MSWLDPGAYGTLGVGGGFALAAALHFPEKEIWIIWGDGSAGYSIAEFDTVSYNTIIKRLKANFLILLTTQIIFFLFRFCFFFFKTVCKTWM